MATIYDMSTGTIVSENDGVTIINDDTYIPEYVAELQPAEETTPETADPCDEYMSIIKELLKKL
jgi:hypothetical protein